MMDLQFDEEPQYGQFKQSPAEQSYFVRLLLSIGVARDKKQAEYILVGVCIAALVISIAILFFFNSSPQYAPQDTNNPAYQMNARYEGGK